MTTLPAGPRQGLRLRDHYNRHDAPDGTITLTLSALGLSVPGTTLNEAEERLGRAILDMVRAGGASEKLVSAFVRSNSTGLPAAEGQSNDSLDLIKSPTALAAALESELPLVLYFSAAWCQPCKTMTPTLEALAVEWERRLSIGKIDVEATPELAGQFTVRTVPTTMLFAAGQERVRIVGARSREALKAELSCAMESFAATENRQQPHDT